MWAIFDLDGTLCNCTHRIVFAQTRQWDEFHSRCLDDQPYKHIVRLAQSWQCEERPLMMLTGRTEKYRKVTEQWLRRHDLFPDLLLMRDDHDFTQDGPYKIKRILEAFGDKERALRQIAFVIDDRDTVVTALRDFGLTVLQPRAGDY